MAKNGIRALMTFAITIAPSIIPIVPAQAQTGWYAQCRIIAAQYADEQAERETPEWYGIRNSFFETACRAEPAGPPVNEYQVWLNNFCASSGKCYLSGW